MTHKRIKTSLIILAVALILLLSACGGKNNQAEDDPNLAITQVFETAMAALTETAMVQSSTPTLTNTAFPTFTTAPTIEVTPTTNTTILPTATTGSPSFVQPTSQTSSCDIGSFVQDVTIPDGKTIAAGDDFTKTWRIKNNGTCTWNENYTVIYYSGEQMADDTMYSFTTEDVEPGESVDISVPMTAPTTNGEYYSYWVLRNDLGQTFYVDGGAIYVQIKVGTVTSSTATPTATTSGSATATVATTPTGNVPTITLITPLNGDSYTTAEEISFSASASDTEDGNISSNIIWYDNDVQFHVGSATSQKITTTGSHTIKVRITDSNGNVKAESVTITITNP